RCPPAPGWKWRAGAGIAASSRGRHWTAMPNAGWPGASRTAPERGLQSGLFDAAAGRKQMQDEILEALRRGDAAAAVDAARARVDAAPDDADALRRLPLALRAAGGVEGAREAIARAIAQVPDDARLHLARAALSIGSRDLEAARASLQAATGVDPNQFAAYVMQGHLAAVGDDLDEAARLAALAARADPE